MHHVYACHMADLQDGKSIISGWSDGKIRAFGPQSGKLLYMINDAHHKAVTALAVTSDSKRVISGGEEGESAAGSECSFDASVAVADWFAQPAQPRIEAAYFCSGCKHMTLRWLPPLAK